MPAAASSATCVVVRVALGERRGEDRRVGGDADDVAVVDELLEPAGGDALAGEVVEPDADADVGELPGWGWSCVLFFLAVAVRQRLRGGERFLGGGDGRLGGDAELAEQGLVVGGGAEVLDRDAAAGVTDVRRQVRARPASIETRALTAAGSTDSRYAASCSSNHSWHGTDTTRALTPSPLSTSRASTAICTSEPVAIRMTSGVPPGASARTYAPLPRRSRGGEGRRRTPSPSPRSNTGRFWRVRAMPAGPLRRSRIVFHASPSRWRRPGARCRVRGWRAAR